jgi:hypothetical protein
LESVKTARLVQNGGGKVWMILEETRRYIPDTLTLDTILRLNDRSVESVEMVTEENLSLWEEGDPLVGLFGPIALMR